MKTFQQKILEKGRPFNKEGTYLLIDEKNAVRGHYKRKLTAISEQKRLEAYKDELKVILGQEFYSKVRK